MTVQDVGQAGSYQHKPYRRPLPGSADPAMPLPVVGGGLDEPTWLDHGDSMLGEFLTVWARAMRRRRLAERPVSRPAPPGPPGTPPGSRRRRARP